MTRHGSGKGTPAADVLDAGAFAVRYRGVYAELWLIAAAITGDRAYADDILQEAAMIALRKLNQFQVGTNFGAWMAEIVRYCALNYSRKIRGRGTTVSDPTLLDETNAESVTANRSFRDGKLPDDQTDFDDDLIRALNKLQETARCCVLLRIVEQLSYAEIADLLKIPEGTAMSHVHRGKRQLRETLLSSQSKGNSR